MKQSKIMIRNVCLLSCLVALGCSADPDRAPGAASGGTKSVSPDAGATHKGGTKTQAPADANDCSSNSSLCVSPASCVPEGDAHRCVCNDGYTGDGEVSCSRKPQVSDCSNGGVTCAAHATCVPDGASYQCACDDDYEGDGVTSCTVPDPTACTGCKVEGEACPGGGECRARACDGQLACHAAEDTACKKIDGEACPKVPLFGACKTCDECATNALCYRNVCVLADCGAADSGKLQCPNITVQGLQVGCAPDSNAGFCTYERPDACEKNPGKTWCALACKTKADCPAPFVDCVSGWCNLPPHYCEQVTT